MRARSAKFADIILIIAVGGCAASGPPATSPSPPPVRVSVDGDYRGTIQLTSASSLISGAQSNWCNTPPALDLSLRNNTFSFVLAHPNIPKDSGYSLSPTFSVAVAPDGSFDATSQNGESEMVGRITGSRMTGQINGTGCAYSFSAERI